MHSLIEPADLPYCPVSTQTVYRTMSKIPKGSTMESESPYSGHFSTSNMGRSMVANPETSILAGKPSNQFAYQLTSMSPEGKGNTMQAPENEHQKSNTEDPQTESEEKSKRFINPYIEEVAKLNGMIKPAQEQYDELVKQHIGKLKNRDKKDYKEQSGLKQAESALAIAKAKMAEVDDYIHTLEVTNESEFQYFNTLSDAEGNDITITIYLFGENQAGTNVGQTKNLAIGRKGAEVIPGATNNNFEINLFSKGKGAADHELNYQSGRNYRTFANELGDIKHWMTKVKDQTSLDFALETMSADSEGYNKPGGMGQESFKYEEDRVKDVKDYAKNSLKPDETYDPYEQTIKKKKE